MIFDRDRRQVLAGPAVAIHIGVRDECIGAGERHAGTHFVQVVRGGRQPLGRLRGLQIGHPFHAADEDDVNLPAANRLDTLRNSEPCGGTGTFDAGGVDADDPGAFGHQWPLVALVFCDFPHEIPVVQCLDVGAVDSRILDRCGDRLGEHLPTRPVGILTKVGRPTTCYSWLLHTREMYTVDPYKDRLDSQQGGTYLNTRRVSVTTNSALLSPLSVLRPLTRPPRGPPRCRFRLGPARPGRGKEIRRRGSPRRSPEDRPDRDRRSPEDERGARDRR